MINLQAIRAKSQVNCNRTDFVSYQRPGSIMTLFAWVCLIWLIGFWSTASASPSTKSLPDRAELIDNILSERIETVLPGLMRRSGLDCWIMVSREYNEDPVLKTFLPSSWFSARRRTILMIFDHGPDQPLETLAVARYAVGQQFKSAWDPESMPDQWQRVRTLLDERQPKRIGINVSETFALADGLTKTDHEALVGAIGPHAGKLASAEDLAVGWLETRSQTEIELYPDIVRLAHDLIARAFSLEAITVGETTTAVSYTHLRAHET